MHKGFALLLVVIVFLTPLRVMGGGGSKATLIIFPDGWVDVSLTLNLTGSEREVNVKIDGEPHYLLVEGEGGLLLNYTLKGDVLRIETLGLRYINVSYQTPSLTSKLGTVWNVTANLGVNRVEVLLPKESVILGMSSIPENIWLEDNWIKLSFTGGGLWIAYKIGKTPLRPPETSTTAQGMSEKHADREKTTYTEESSLATSSANVNVNLSSPRGISGPSTTTPSRAQGMESMVLLLIPILAAIFAVFVLKSKLRSRKNGNQLDRPDELEIMILNELRRRGGKARQSDLVKSLEAPRATVWRRIRRMAKEGKVDLIKEGRFTVVKLKEGNKPPDAS